MRQRKLASVKNWHNGNTPLRAIELAREFLMHSTIPPSLRTTGEAALELFRSDPAGAKKLVNALGPSEFGCSLDYLEWAQFRALFLKSTDGGSMNLRQTAALRAFLGAEASCKRTNKRLAFYAEHSDRENPLYRVILTRARGLISRTLGNFSERTLERILELARPGGGVSIGTVHRNRVSLPFKLGETSLCSTPDALPYAVMLVGGSKAWSELHVRDHGRGLVGVQYETTPYNRLAFVPKDASTLRSIAVEPSLNVCLQLGVHGYLLQRLKGVGVDLRSQERNQRLAKCGAAGWQSADPLATLDLSAASDSMSRELVRRLLPTTWYEFLDALRSKYFRWKGGEPIEYQKWSSMGNGYTFALESLIFWALARACLTMTNCEQEVAVYGDDIIIPRSAALLMIEILKYTGFSINRDKTFVTGPFRESCGSDFFGSQQVTPVYIRNRSHLRPTDIYRVVNGLRNLGLHSEAVEALCRKAHRGRPILYGLCTGDEAGNWWVDSSFAKRVGSIRWNRQVQAYEQRTARYVPHPRGVPPLWAYTAALLGQRGSVMDPLEGEDWSVTKAPERESGRWTTSVRAAG